MTQDPRIPRIPDSRTGLDVDLSGDGPLCGPSRGGETGHYGQNPRSNLGDILGTARMRRSDVPAGRRNCSFRDPRGGLI